MTPELGKAIMDVLAQRIGPRVIPCEICGGTRWDIQGMVKEMAQPSLSGGLVIGGRSFPLALLSCVVCGNTKHLNLIGLLGKDRVDSLAALENGQQLLDQALGGPEIKKEESKGV